MFIQYMYKYNVHTVHVECTCRMHYACTSVQVVKNCLAVRTLVFNVLLTTLANEPRRLEGSLGSMGLLRFLRSSFMWARSANAWPQKRRGEREEEGQKYREGLEGEGLEGEGLEGEEQKYVLHTCLVQCTCRWTVYVHTKFTYTCT